MIRVLFFAQLRDIFKRDEMNVPMKRPLTARELLLHLFHEAGVDVARLGTLRYVVNERIVPDNTPLRRGDTIAFLTPMSGG